MSERQTKGNKIKRRKHSFRTRMKTSGGRKVVKSRRQKGRVVLAASA